MAIIKIRKRENPYVQIDKQPINNPLLSWRAKGLLVYLLSKPDSWEINVKDLTKKAPSGRDTVYKILDELIAVGHIERVVIREKGKFGGYGYIVHEQPITPFPEKPDTAKPDTEIPTHTNNEDTKKESIKVMAEAAASPKPLYTRAVEVFHSFYLEVAKTKYLFDGKKDGENLKKLLKKVESKTKEAGLEPTDDAVIEGLILYLYSITDNWVLKNLSIPIVNSKFNELFNQAINGNSKSTAKGNVSGALSLFEELQ